MKIKIFVTILLGLLLSGCLTPGERYLDNTRITALVNTKFANNLDVSTLKGINVSTKDKIVTLSGTIQSQQQAQEAVALTKSIPDVKGIKNSLIVKR